jgi:hypothetical protein
MIVTANILIEHIYRMSKLEVNIEKLECSTFRHFTRMSQVA